MLKSSWKKSIFFSDRENNIDFCSQNCQLKFEKNKEEENDRKENEESLAQKWLNKEYPRVFRSLKDTEYRGNCRDEVFYLDLKDLIGKLDLSDFVNMRTLNFYEKIIN